MRRRACICLKSRSDFISLYLSEFIPDAFCGGRRPGQAMAAAAAEEKVAMVAVRVRAAYAAWS